MSTSLDGNTGHDSVGTWLKRLALVVATALLAFCCWLVWRVSMVAYQVETAIVSISGDVKQMSSTGAQISQHLQQLDERLRAIEEKAAEAANLDEVEHMIDELSVIRDGKSTPPNAISADTEKEIKHLLSRIRRSDHRFIYSDEDKGGTRFYLQLYAKYKTYENSVTSAEDFIDKVATSTIAGHPYHVVVNADRTMALSDWLTDELKRFREANALSDSDE